MSAIAPLGERDPRWTTTPELYSFLHDVMTDFVSRRALPGDWIRDRDFPVGSINPVGLERDGRLGRDILHIERFGSLILMDAVQVGNTAVGHDEAAAIVLLDETGHVEQNCSEKRRYQHNTGSSLLLAPPEIAPLNVYDRDIMRNLSSFLLNLES